jgi:hypothetical protein
MNKFQSSNRKFEKTEGSAQVRTGLRSRLVARTAKALAAVMLVASVGGVALSAAPAQAAAGTTKVTVCPTRNTSLATPTIDSYWYNGSAWTTEASVRTTGCATFTLKHSGYYYFHAGSYVLLPCVEYVYGVSSGVYIKQNMAANTTISGTMAYLYSIPFC